MDSKINKYSAVCQSSHLLNNNDIGTQHLKTSGKVHHVGPAKNQRPSHQHILSGQSAHPLNAQNHDQTCIANPAMRYRYVVHESVSAYKTISFLLV